MNQQYLFPVCLGMQWEKEGHWCPVRFRSFGLTYCDVQFPGNEKRRTCSLHNELEHRQNAFTATSVVLEQIGGIASLTARYKHGKLALEATVVISSASCLKGPNMLSSHALLSHWCIVTACIRLESSQQLQWCFGVSVHFWLPKTAQHLWKTTATLRLPHFVSAVFRELFLLSGSDKDRTAKKISRRLPCFLRTTLSWLYPGALHLPHLFTHKTKSPPPHLKLFGRFQLTLAVVEDSRILKSW